MVNPMNTTTIKSKETNKTRPSKLLEGVGVWGSFYRIRPDKFVTDYLGLHLYLYQRVLICMMMFCTNLIYCAARGQGKTFLTSMFCVVKCVLFPGTKVCVCSKSLKQAKGVLLKIQQELMPNSAVLRAEIESIRINNAEGIVTFKNGSFIFMSVASDNARGYRCNVLIVDEFVLVDPVVIAAVLKKFLNVDRVPGFMSKPEYRNNPKYRERNQEIYMSSCWLKSSWGWEKLQDYTRAMMNPKKKYFVCGLPYQLSIKEGLLNKSAIEDEMAEGSFNSILFSMENECLWWGEAIDGFFNYGELLDSRKNAEPLYAKNVRDLISNTIVKNPKKEKGELRMISVDVALMSSKKRNNDATSIFVWRLVPNKTGQYARYIAYAENIEGRHSEDQAIHIRQLFEDLECDYIVIDRVGLSMTVVENLIKDLVDPNTGETYQGLSCMNDSEIASRYKGSASLPKKCIYAINGSSLNNNIYAIKFRDALKMKKIIMPITEQEFKDNKGSTKEFLDLSESEKIKVKMPYIETTLAINEIVNLKYEDKNGLIKIIENSTARKDRYSSLSYGNAFVDYLEDKKKRKRNNNEEQKSGFKFRQPKYMQRH